MFRLEGSLPPLIRIGMFEWMKLNLFNGIFNSILTVVVLFFLWKIIPPFVQWAFIDSFWLSTADQCRAGDGACWSIIPANFRFIIFGFYPYELHWRPSVAMIILVGLLFYSKNRDHWKISLAYIWIAGLVIMGLLMKGGILGLTPVESDQWGGLPLTLMLSVFGMFAAYPLGIFLALGRRSKMPAIRTISILYIEMIRGVPLISMLFMSAVMFPLFLPQGLTVNKILRAQVAIILFTAAYIAEVVRGGLQAITRGQYEAAESLGLELCSKDAAGDSSPGPENRHSADGGNPDFRLQGYLAGGHHRPVRYPENDPVHAFQSHVDGIQPGGLYLRCIDLFCLLLCHVQLQPSP